MKSITVPASVKSIGKYAFAFCSNLDDFKYLGTNTPTINTNTFDECSNLKAVKVTSNYLDDECCSLPIIRFGVCGNSLNWELQQSTGVLKIFGTGQMINYTTNSPAPWNMYKSDVKTINVGEDVKSIGNNAFASCNNLISVDLPNSITSIGNSAFSGCENLSTLSLGNGIITIGSNAFESCKKLSSVSFYGFTEPTNDGTAFVQCDLLVEANVPTTYDKDTFCGLSVAKTIIVPTPTPETPELAPKGSDLSDENSTTSSTTSSGSSKLSGGGIFGIIVGALATIVTIFGGSIYLIKKCHIDNCCGCCNDCDCSRGHDHSSPSAATA